ncbi:MAG: nucleotidyltransferase family protein [Bdellovibrionaceae bacterium]|nr:nucleotidyltransferase family protein [Pseudobdellovibrionaceae bacterium]
MKAMILAAGEGTRLRPYTLSLPKPAIPFLGVPLAFYGIELLKEVGATDLVVNHHHLSGEIQKLFAGRSVEFSDESAGLLGSGGGIHKAKPYLQNETDFFVLNGDEVILPERQGQLRAALEHHRSAGNLMTICVKEHPDVGTKFGGVWTDAQNQVVKFSKTPVEGLKGWHYTGILVFSNRIFSYFKNSLVEENILYETAALAMSKGEKVSAFPIDCQWFETGNPADFKAATEECLEALQQPGRQGWVQWLSQFLSSQNPREALVEKEDLLLNKKLLSFWSKLKP